MALPVASDWAPPPAKPMLSKSTLVGICLTMFASGILVATAFDRVRPHAVVDRPPAAARGQTPVVEIQPLPPAEPALPQLPPVAAAIAGAPVAVAGPVPAVAPVAATTAPVVAGRRPASKPSPVRARPAPAVRAKQTSPTDSLSAEDPFATEPAFTTPPAPKKWVDPFAQ